MNPRVARTRQRVLAGARQVLASRGVAGLTVDAVAKQARVSRTTIYRHWPEMSNLVVDAAASAAADVQPVSEMGSLHADLVAIFDQLAAVLSHPTRGAELAAFLATAERDPEVRRTYVAFVQSQRRHVSDVLARAIANGELPPDTDLDLAVDLLAAPAFYRRLVLGEPPSTPGYIERVIQTVLAGLGFTAHRLHRARKR